MNYSEVCSGSAQSLMGDRLDAVSQGLAVPNKNWRSIAIVIIIIIRRHFVNHRHHHHHSHWHYHNHHHISPSSSYSPWFFLDVVSQGIAKECFIKIEIKSVDLNILWPRISSIRRVKELRIILSQPNRSTGLSALVSNTIWRIFSAKGGGEVPPLPPLLFYQKTGNFWPYTTFTHFSFFLALFGPVLARFGPFLILFQAKTPFLAILGEIFLGSNFEL